MSVDVGIIVSTTTNVIIGSDVSAGMNLFGNGNVELGVELFEQQHSCSTNRYCGWPGFKLQSFESLDSSV